MRSLAVAALLLLPASQTLGQAPATVPSPASEPGPTGWPRIIETAAGRLETYQPQIERYEGVTLSGRSAVAWTGKDRPAVFGVIWFTATVYVDRDTRQAAVEHLQVTKVRFPNVNPDEERKVAAVIEAEVPRWDLTVGLDAIQASLAVSQAERRSSEGLRSTPPRMLFSNEPAVLLLYAGKPVEQPIAGSDLRRVVNTAMFVVLDPAARQYYLSGGKVWYEADAATGPFRPVAAPSPAVRQFYDRNPPPPEKPTGDAADQAAEKALVDPASPPRILVSTEPAELFVFDGPPRYVPVGAGADLLFAENTQRDVLVYVPTGETYVLASGRWFKARSLAGPWTAVRPDRLPAGFASLPPDSPVGGVRTFVSGTEEAQDALADAQIPQTTAVRRDQKFEVVYDGEPRFKPIDGTTMAFAVNTSSSVIRDAGRYWACDQAVWYVAPSPKGPWTVSDGRPPDIDQVPPSAPVYNTRYVYVYQSTPEVVYVGYLPGYVGMYPYYGTVVYGTGFVYPPYIGPAVYYPRPVTYGFGVTYNPWIGFGFAYGFASPFVSVGIHFCGWGYPYYRSGWWGPPGYRPYPPPYPGGWYRPPPGYRPPYPGTGFRPPPPGGSNSSLYSRPDNRARNADKAPAVASRPAPRPATGPNNVYADRKGNVYRQNPGGTWDRNTPQGWKLQPSAPAGGKPSARPAGRPAPSPASRPTAAPTARPSHSSAPAGLGKDAAARQRTSSGSRPPAAAAQGGGGGRGR